MYTSLIKRVERRKPVPTRNLTLSALTAMFALQQLISADWFCGLQACFIYIILAKGLNYFNEKWASRICQHKERTVFIVNFIIFPHHKQNTCSHCFDILNSTIQKSYLKKLECFLKVELICAKKGYMNWGPLFFSPTLKSQQQELRNRTAIHNSPSWSPWYFLLPRNILISNFVAKSSHT